LKKILFFLFFFSFLFSLEIVVDTTNKYSILTITNDTKFSCKEKNKHEYICKFFTHPTTPLFSTNTLYFMINPFYNKKYFYLKIKTKNKSFIKSFEKNLYEGYNKRLVNLKLAKKWVIIAYKKQFPFFNFKKVNGLKFPLEIKNNFYLKAVDINGNPIDYNSETADVIEYFTLLKLANKKTLTLDRINEFLKIYPKSIFIPDVEFLKLKVLDEEGNNDKIIELANIWLKKYSFNEHLAEVILLLAKTYANNGMMEDATYMYERLFTEYENTKYAYEGMIYLADQLYSEGDNKRAFKLYKKVLINTKNIEIASLAALRLAQRYLDEGNIKKSLKYYTKLFNANKNFILKDKNNAYNIANQLSKSKAYKLAIKIDKEILKKLKPLDDLYEAIIYKLAKWNFNIKNFKESEKYINLYLKKFPYGDFSDEMRKLKDKILFNITDKNITKTLKNLDILIKTYSNSDIYTKAINKKIEILYKLKKYKDVIVLAKKVKDTNKTILKNSIYNLVISDLNKMSNCSEVISYYKDYNLTIPEKYDDNLFKCAYNTNHFDIASQICNKYLLRNDKIALKWLKNKAKIFEITYKYKKLILVINDICNIQKKDCYKWKYKQFFAYYYLNNVNEFLKIANNLLNKNNVKNIDIFLKVVLFAKNKNNNLLIYTYAKKILQLEKQYHVYDQSPFIDFIFVEIANKLHKKQEAIQVLKNLLRLKLNDENKARTYYTLTSLTTNPSYLKACIKLDKSKIWKPLCKSSLELYK